MYIIKNNTCDKIKITKLGIQELGKRLPTISSYEDFHKLAEQLTFDELQYAEDICRQHEQDKCYCIADGEESDCIKCSAYYFVEGLWSV